jgi:hypothetical protein
MGPVANRASAGAMLLLLAASGCVERYLRIDSDPAGARICVDGRDVGDAPVDVPFVHYGTLRIDAWVADRPGVTQTVELVPPWYQRFPLDLFSELLDPFTHVDRHDRIVTIPEAEASDREGAESRAQSLRRESQ